MHCSTNLLQAETMRKTPIVHQSEAVENSVGPRLCISQRRLTSRTAYSEGMAGLLSTCSRKSVLGLYYMIPQQKAFATAVASSYAGRAITLAVAKPSDASTQAKPAYKKVTATRNWGPHSREILIFVPPPNGDVSTAKSGCWTSGVSVVACIILHLGCIRKARGAFMPACAANACYLHQLPVLKATSVSCSSLDTMYFALILLLKRSCKDIRLVKWPNWYLESGRISA